VIAQPLSYSLAGAMRLQVGSDKHDVVVDGLEPRAAQPTLDLKPIGRPLRILRLHQQKNGRNDKRAAG